MHFEDVPRTVKGACYSLLVMGVLGLVPIVVGAIPSLVSNYWNQVPIPNPQTWRWKVSPQELFWTLSTVLAVYCVVWIGWILSAIAIYWGKWWGWLWAMSLCFGFFVISIDLAFITGSSISYSAQTLLLSVFTLGLFCLFLSRPSVIQYCGIDEYHLGWVHSRVALGAFGYIGLYWIVRMACERLA